MKNPLFYAKILLFGEYGIIKNAMGLCIPYNSYKAEFIKRTFKSEEEKKSNLVLQKYLQYLKDIVQEKELKLDLESFEKDIQDYMHFDSNIPQGYGVGSSGALVAAIYDKYATDKIQADRINKEDIIKLKNIFSVMEDYFHGNSSGTDPLICYLKIPLLFKSKTHIDTINLPKRKNKGAIFLINSGEMGQTGPMVNIFMEKYKQERFKKALSTFISYNNACIKSFLKGNTKNLFQNIKELSEWVLDHMNVMIPAAFHKLWRQGLETNAYYLKLCGSGGGGFILGFTIDYAKTKEMLKDYSLEIVYEL